jgi:hypothetical protein
MRKEPLRNEISRCFGNKGTKIKGDSEICGGQSGTGAGFSQNNSVFPCQSSFHLILVIIIIIRS